MRTKVRTLLPEKGQWDKALYREHAWGVKEEQEAPVDWPSKNLMRERQEEARKVKKW